MLICRRDPGPCPICGAPHSACTTTTPVVVVDQLPAATAAAARARAATSTTPVAEAIQATLPAGTFTTATYRGDPDKPRRFRRR